MKQIDKALAAVLALALPTSLAAGPDAAANKPAAAKAAAPAAKAAAPAAKAAAPAKLTPLQTSLKTAVESMIKEVSSDNEGEYPLNDSLSDESWNTTLKGFDWSGMRDVEAEEKVVRAEFTGAGKTFVVDFTLRLEQHRWEIIDETVISVDGVERFVYNSKNERLPVKRAAEPESVEDTPSLDDEFSLPEDGDEGEYSSDDSEGI